MILYERIMYKGKPYIYAGFGAITKKKYPIQINTKGEFIVFNGKRVFI